MNLDFGKLCGKHSAIYEAYYKQIDPKGTGTIEAMTGAKFLKKSGLSDIVLSRVWDLADPNGKGFLDKPGFLVALKMVAVAQAGETVNMKNIYFETENPPKVGEIPKTVPARIQTVPGAGPAAGITNDWSIGVIDRLKYEQLFESLKPVNGMLPGNKVKGVLLDSKLPMDTLGKIWDLADQDRDGNLDKHEFLVAMHLVYKTLEKRTVPDVLPPELRKPGAAVHGGPPPKPAPPVGVGQAAMPKAPSGEGFGDGGFVANFPKDIAPPPALPPMPGIVPPMSRVPPIGAPITTQPLLSTDPLIPIGAPPSVTANADWVVIPSELKRYEVMFRDSDRDKDGLVSGIEVKNIFLQSGVPQNCLAHIWALCDTNQSGKLTLEQFALAMWMVERKQKGIEPPQVLTANMVPPSMRGIISGVDVQPQETKPTYNNPELEMISKEIEELSRERRALETEVAQKDADIRIKTGEVRSLQSELDTLSATLKQLEHQRGEAEKRLDDLKAQVTRIREQCQKQEDTINEQEGELNAKRSEFQKLKDEETALQKEYDENNRELQKLTNHLQNTQLQISSVRSMVTQLMETQRQMTDALLICRAAIESENTDLVSEYQLKIEPDLDDARKTLEKKIEDPSADPFTEAPSAATMNNGFATNGFDSVHDPFTASSDNKKTMPAIGGFDDSFNAGGFDSGFDAFGSSAVSGFGQTQKDPFGGDAFGSSKSNAITPEPGKDDFGSDPFASLHAPTGKGQVLSPNSQKSGPPARPESPSPALPPKKSKVPPPRPAPPRPLQGPPRPAQPSADAFGSSTASSGGFADFADFDNKLSSIPAFASFTSNKNSSSTTTTKSPLKSTMSSSVSSLTSQNIFSQNPSFFDSNNDSFAPIATPSSSNINALSSSLLTSNLSSTFSLSTPNVNINTSNPQRNETISNKLTNRSTTPSVQQMNSHLEQSTSKMSQPSLSSKMSTTPVVAGPTDFSDDPFKDYRYDDLCNIQDPFADDEDLDPEKIFKDIDYPDINTTLKKDSLLSSAASASENKVNNELLDKFEAFHLSPSPVLSNKSLDSIGKQGGTIKSQSTTPIANNNNNIPSDPFGNFADFDAFSSNSTTSSTKENSISSTNVNSNPSKTKDIFFDAFGDFSKVNKLNSKESFKQKQEKTEDPFGLVNSSTTTTSKNSTKSIYAFDDDGDDAFGFDKNFNPANAAPIQVYDAFNDQSFQNDFFKTPDASKQNNNNLSSNNNGTKNKSPLTLTSNDAFNANFAKFDAFTEDGDSAFSANPSKSNSNAALNNVHDSAKFPDDFSASFGTAGGSWGAKSDTGHKSFPKLKNPTVLNKTSNFDLEKRNLNNMETNANAGAASVKLPEKFVADYSKPETFDADLEEAIQRSMIDQ